MGTVRVLTTRHMAGRTKSSIAYVLYLALGCSVEQKSFVYDIENPVQRTCTCKCEVSWYDPRSLQDFNGHLTS